MPSAKHHFLRNLTAALLAGEWQTTPMNDRAARACGKRHRWIRPLVRRVLAAFPAAPTIDTVYAYLNKELEFHGLWVSSFGSRRGATRFQVAEVFWVPDHMTESAVPVNQTLPQMATLGALGEWLQLPPKKLDWFIDAFDQNPDELSEQLQHYYYRWVPKRRPVVLPPEPAPKQGWFGRLFGMAPPPPPAPTMVPAPVPHRLLEIPKERLKEIQRKILAEILTPVPPHPAAHGFRRGGSVVTNATPHCGCVVVMKFDLTDFFTSVLWARVQAIFHSLGYPHAIASALAGLCTVRTGRRVLLTQPYRHEQFERDTWMRLRERHLPQGSPTSPALANLAAYHLDCRLTGLAAYYGATYTRYADDLTFSGGRQLFRIRTRFQLAVQDIAANEGFVVNPHKTRVMGQAGRQTVTGVVVNVRPNVARTELDLLKAILTNCVRHGPASQNRGGHRDFRTHLRGRVAHITQLNAARGAKLKALFDRIRWPV